MKRNHRKIIAITTIIAGLFVISGCAEIVEETNQMAITSLEKENVVSLNVQEYVEENASELESKYLAGILTQEEYLLYAEELTSESRMYESRTVLEDCYRLFLDEEAFLRLQKLTVNLKEDDTEIMDESVMLMDFLQAGNKENDIISEMMSNDMFLTLMPKLYEGCRNYYLDENSRSLYLTVGYDPNCNEYVKLWYVDENAGLTHYEYADNQVKKLYTSLDENGFQGVFHSVVCDGSYGDIFVEAGEFRNGLLNGEYRLDYYLGENETDLYSLSCNWEEFELKSFYGKFEDGKSTFTQEESMATGEDTADRVIYAYDENAEKYLYASNSSFDYRFLGWSQMPEVQKYEPFAEIEDEQTALAGEAASGSYTNQPVRVYDGQIQWFDGKRWKNVGSVDKMIEQDPFYEYREQAKEKQKMEELKDEKPSNSEPEGDNSSDNSESGEVSSESNAQRVSQLRERIVENTGISTSLQNTGTDNSGTKPGTGSSSSTGHSSGTGSNSSSGHSAGTGSGSGSANAGTSGTGTQTPSTPTPQPSNSTPQPSNSTPQPSNPEPQPSNPEPQPSNPEPQPSNPEPQPSNPEPQPSNPEPQPSNPEPSNPDPGNNGDTDIGWGDWSDAELEP